MFMDIMVRWPRLFTPEFSGTKWLVEIVVVGSEVTHLVTGDHAVNGSGEELRTLSGLPH